MKINKLRLVISFVISSLFIALFLSHNTVGNIYFFTNNETKESQASSIQSQANSIQSQASSKFTKTKGEENSSKDLYLYHFTFDTENNHSIKFLDLRLVYTTIYSDKHVGMIATLIETFFDRQYYNASRIQEKIPPRLWDCCFDKITIKGGTDSGREVGTYVFNISGIIDIRKRANKYFIKYMHNENEHQIWQSKTLEASGKGAEELYNKWDKNRKYIKQYYKKQSGYTDFVESIESFAQ